MNRMKLAVEMIEARLDLSRAYLHHGHRSFGRHSDIDHLPSVRKRPLLGDVQVAAQVNARGDLLERLQEAALAAVRVPRGQIGRASCRERVYIPLGAVSVKK